MDRSNALATTLASIVKELGISNSEYAIIAGYCVYKITGRPITDLDVICSREAYRKFRERYPSLVSRESASGDEKVSLGAIDIFSQEDTGYPSNEFSLRNLHSGGCLSIDELGNPYLNRPTTVRHYSIVVRDTQSGQYTIGNYKISRERVEKNIRHLELINLHFNCQRELDYLRSLLR